MLKRVVPGIVIVLGGREVSYESAEQQIVQLADYLVTGWGDVTLPQLCKQILHGPKPLMKVHVAACNRRWPISPCRTACTATTTSRIARCTWKPHATACSNANSVCRRWTRPRGRSRLTTSWPRMEALHARGARLFKFVDRTFNLNVKTSLKIL